MDLLVVGSGLSGAVVAQRFASLGKKVVLIEKRPFLGGNVRDQKIDGVTVHTYGPHIFHTSNERVNSYMSRFWSLNGFKNKVKGEVGDKSVSIPFNFAGIDALWPDESEEIKRYLLTKYTLNQRISILDLMKESHPLVKKVATFVFDNIFKNYTTKMWGVPIEQIDKGVIARVPMVMGYEDRYFSDKYEGLPREGYEKTIKNMLDSDLIDIHLNSDATKVLSFVGNEILFQKKVVNCPIVFCGPIDELFDYRFGKLSYRSLQIGFTTIAKRQYQPVAVVNKPSDPLITRITEYKHMTLEKVNGKTVISQEIPGNFDEHDMSFNERYYPMQTKEAKDSFSKYKEYSEKFSNLYLLGRLATFQYLNMDQAIILALEMADRLLENDIR